MKVSDRKRRALEGAKTTIERFATHEAAWKRRLADAVLGLARDHEDITVDSLVRRLTAMGEKNLVIEGMDLEISVSRLASEMAIAKLQEAAGMEEDEAGEQ